MTKILFALVFVASVTGCKKKSGGDMTGKYTEFKDAMCACKAGDTACAKKVSEDMAKWAADMAKSAEKDKVDPAEAAEMAKKLEPINTELAKCMTAAMTPAGAGGGGAGAGGGGAGKPPMEAVTFKATGTKNDKGWMKFEAQNHGDKAVKFLSVWNYAYDSSGKQVARTSGNLSWNGEIKPGDKSEVDHGSDAAPATATDFEMCYDAIKFEGGEIEHGPSDRCPSERPKSK